MDTQFDIEMAPQPFVGRMPDRLPVLKGMDDRFTTGLLLDLDAVLVRYGYQPAVADGFANLARTIGGYIRATGQVAEPGNQSELSGSAEPAVSAA